MNTQARDLGRELVQERAAKLDLLRQNQILRDELDQQIQSSKYAAYDAIETDLSSLVALTRDTKNLFDQLQNSRVIGAVRKISPRLNGLMKKIAEQSQRVEAAVRKVNLKRHSSHSPHQIQSDSFGK